jgi:hypothetical protein
MQHDTTPDCGEPFPVVSGGAQPQLAKQLKVLEIKVQVLIESSVVFFV